MRRDRNNLKAGIFVVLGVILAVLMTLMLSDMSSWFTRMQPLTVHYTLRDGLQGLKVGSAVTIGYEPAGLVTAIENELDGDGVVIGKLVKFEIPAEYKVYDNAIVELAVPPLGSGTTLNISSFGFSHAKGDMKGGQLYAKGEVLEGGIAENILVRNMVKNMGIGDLQREQIQQIIASVQQVTAVVSGGREKLTTLMNAMAEDVPQITSDAKAVVAKVRERSDAWMGRIDSVTVNADESLAQVRQMLAENRGDIRAAVEKGKATMDNAEAITKQLREQTMQDLTTAMTKVQTSLDNIQQTTEHFKTLMGAELPVIERMVANLRLTSDQLKLAAIEIRRAPWRLLYEPTDKELDSENLYDAARSFSLAAGDLDSTAASLKSLLDSYDGKLKAEDPQVQMMLDNLKQAFEKYLTAEGMFWDSLKNQAK